MTDHDEEIYDKRLYKKLKVVIDGKLERYVKSLSKDELCRLIDFESISVALKEEVLEDIKNLQRSRLLTYGIRYEIRRIMKKELRNEFKNVMEIHRQEFERMKSRLFDIAK